MLPVLFNMSEPAFEIWGTEDSSVTIEYSLVVLEEIRQEVSQGAMKFSRGGIEVGGILYGTRDGRKIRIESIRPIVCDHARGPSFLLSDDDRAKLEKQFADEATDQHLTGLIRVGWYVSHTRGELAMTEADLELFSNYFRDPWQVTLVIRPGRGSHMRAAFFVWENDGTVRSHQSYKEFNFPDRLSGVLDTAPPRSERSESRGAFRTLPPLPPPPVRVERPQPRPMPMPVFEGSQYYPSPVPERKKWPWMVGIVAVLGVAAFVFLRFFWQAAPPETLGLQIAEREGQLQISWSNTSRTIVHATRGVLNILDGPTPTSVPLTRMELGEGKYMYTRQGGDVEVRMEVESSDGTVRESSRFLGRPPAPAKADTDATQILESQNAELQKENDRLKAQNASLSERIQTLERTQKILESRLGITGK